jgi:hypothetical protein
MSEVITNTPMPVTLRAGAAGVESGLAVQAGSILIDLGVDPPKSLLVRSRSLPNGWGLIQDPAYMVDAELSDAGWNLFYLAGEIKVGVAGFDRSHALQAALNRVIRKVKSQKCNSFQVARITESSFLGISRVGIYGHVRHLQKGRLLLGG